MIERIVRESGVPDLLDILGERLAPTDLQSLQLEVYRRRAAAVTPARLLSQYEQNSMVRPSPVSPRTLLAFDQLAFALACPPFEAVELAPVAPLGSSSSIATVDQNQALATARNTEVVSDSTNLLALECAVRRRAAVRAPGSSHATVRLCASHRLLRPQTSAGPTTFMHFRLFGLCTAGRDTGGFRFETAALREQLVLYVRLLTQVERIGRPLAGLRVALTDLLGTRRRELEQEVVEPLARELRSVEWDFDDARVAGRGYYEQVCFMVWGHDGTAEHALVDGGFTSWTQQLLSNRKERLLISGIGSERVCSLFAE